MMPHLCNYGSLRTGAEAMFADLGHFSKKGIQVIFINITSLNFFPCELFMTLSVKHYVFFFRLHFCLAYILLWSLHMLGKQRT
jgi:K+ transporter